jgi:hypothetical protein
MLKNIAVSAAKALGATMIASVDKVVGWDIGLNV